MDMPHRIRMEKSRSEIPTRRELEFVRLADRFDRRAYWGYHPKSGLGIIGNLDDRELYRAAIKNEQILQKPSATERELEDARRELRAIIFEASFRGVQIRVDSVRGAYIEAYTALRTKNQATKTIEPEQPTAKAEVPAQPVVDTRSPQQQLWDHLEHGTPLPIDDRWRRPIEGLSHVPPWVRPLTETPAGANEKKEPKK